VKNSIKLIMFFICIWLLSPSLQSCIYFKTTPEKASIFQNRRIRIKTIEDELFQVKWIEIRNDTIHSTTHVKRSFIEKSEIDKYMICQTECLVVNLDTALISNGNILVRKLEFKDRNALELGSYNYTFHKIADAGDHIIGYHWNGADSVNIKVPISSIKKVTKVNKGASVTVVVVGLFPVTMFTWAVIGLSQMGEEF